MILALATVSLAVTQSSNSTSIATTSAVFSNVPNVTAPSPSASYPSLSESRSPLEPSRGSRPFVASQPSGIPSSSVSSCQGDVNLFSPNAIATWYSSILFIPSSSQSPYPSELLAGSRICDAAVAPVNGCSNGLEKQNSNPSGIPSPSVSQSDGPFSLPSPSISSLNQARPFSSACAANGAVLLTGSSKSTPQFCPVSIIIIIVEFDISWMSSNKSPSESAFVGSVPYSSSSRLNNWSPSESRTLSHECSPAALARSSQSATPFFPSKWSFKISIIPSVNSGQSQLPDSGSNRV